MRGRCPGVGAPQGDPAGQVERGRGGAVTVALTAAERGWRCHGALQVDPFLTRCRARCLPAWEHSEDRRKGP